MLGMIYAASYNGVIGNRGRLPWHLPEDLQHFRALTFGSTVIMGRKTWDSLPPKLRPLPDRDNIVVSRSLAQLDGAKVAHTLGDALTLASRHKPTWVIGGGEIYRLAMPFCSRIEATVVHLDVDGDTKAPELGDDWTIKSLTEQVSSTGLRYSFVSMHRKQEQSC